MPREPLPTPVDPFTGLIPDRMRDPDYQIGVLARLDATVGRRKGALGPDDEGVGLARAFYEHRDEVRTTLGRMPGTRGIEDQGEGIARLAWEHRQASLAQASAIEATRIKADANVRKATAGFIIALTALVVAVTGFVRAEAAAKADQVSPPSPPAQVR